MLFYQQPITQIVIAPNLEVLATCSLDGFVKMWNICFDEEEDPRYLNFLHSLIFYLLRNFQQAFTLSSIRPGMNRRVDGWMDGWMVGWMDGWMDGWLDGWMDGWMVGWMDGWMDGWLDGWMVGWMDGWMDGWLDGWMDGWMDSWIDACTQGLSCIESLIILLFSIRINF